MPNKLLPPVRLMLPSLGVASVATVCKAAKLPVTLAAVSLTFTDVTRASVATACALAAATCDTTTVGAVFVLYLPKAPCTAPHWVAVKARAAASDCSISVSGAPRACKASILAERLAALSLTCSDLTRESAATDWALAAFTPLTVALKPPTILFKVLACPTHCAALNAKAVPELLWVMVVTFLPKPCNADKLVAMVALSPVTAMATTLLLAAKLLALAAATPLTDKL